MEAGKAAAGSRSSKAPASEGGRYNGIDGGGILAARCDANIDYKCAGLEEIVDVRELKEKEKCRGASLRGQGSPGFILPASAVSEQGNCGGNLQPPNSVLFRVCKLHLGACKTSPDTLKHFWFRVCTYNPETRLSQGL
jgi:hypothetical protein